MRRSTIHIILLLLTFALLVQNTCPHGFAGKSTAASACSHCPQKQTHSKPAGSDQPSIAAHSSVHFPIFVLDIPDTRPLIRLMSIASPQPAIPNTYEDVLPDELFQPPRA